ncbi:DNA-processing protein DprA [Boudabousia marimammalium]|uniref:DNA protecting protein DprA n=1 Tax=Boudabousia marimammalium TaxID=156892 RepID=A0A1Q5PRR3_9ACTO|nr:DNA-processing protein DprA [Boudabousia marimammalium]OKL50125.1 DNA protecting protein DprA [Boudabousia marimammalium]
MFKQNEFSALPGVNDETTARMIWSSILEPPDRVAYRLISAYGAAAALGVCARSLDSRDQQSLLAKKLELPADNLRNAMERWKPRAAACQLQRMEDGAARHEIRFLCPRDPSWPQQLSDLGEDAPIGLWLRGKIPQGMPVSIVGARIASNYGETVARDFAYELNSAGSVIVSGGAFGIDACAHQGALAANGNTVAFMAGGLDRLYPADLFELHQRIISTGAVVSEFPPGARPARWRFLSRNRLIAGYSATTIVIEANIRSGALNTARTALKIGRPVGAVPGPIHSQLSSGTNQLIRDGASLVSRSEHIVDLMAQSAQTLLPYSLLQTDVIAGVDTAEAGEMTASQRRVYDALPPHGAGITPERISVATGLAPYEALGLLGQLELCGRVKQTGAQWSRLQGA